MCGQGFFVIRLARSFVITISPDEALQIGPLLKHETLFVQKQQRMSLLLLD